MRTPTNPFEVADTVEVFVPKEISDRRIQHIFAGPNKGRKADHYLVVWEDYPLEKDYTWEPIENLYGHEDLAQTYEQWLKTENERLDSVEAERKTARKMTAQKVQDVAADQFRKNDKFTKKNDKFTDVTGRLVISRAWYTLQTLSWLFATHNRTWCRQSVASCLRVQEKPVE